MKPLMLATKVFTHDVGDRPAVASNGRDYLVATGHQNEVYGLPIAANGQHAPAFPIAKNAANGGEPGLAFHDGRYCVAWKAPDLSTRIRAAFVHDVHRAWHVHPPGGVVVDAPGSSTATSLGNAKPSVAYGGGQWLIVWNGDARLVCGTARGTRFTDSAHVVDPVPLDITGAGDLTRPAVVRLVEGFLVASTAMDEVRGARVGAARISPGGAVAAGPAIPVSGRLAQTILPSAANGEPHQALLVWTDIPAGLRGARVAASGQFVDARGFDIAPGNGESAVAWANGRNAYLVAWRAGAEIRGAVIDSGGRVQAPAALVTGATGTALALASNGSDFLLVWEGGWAIVS